MLTDEAPYWDLEDVRVPIELYLGNKPNTPPEVKIDQVHRDLMRWCWETDPHARPTITQAHEVLKDFILGHWQYV